MIIREQIQANPTKLWGRGFVSSHRPATCCLVKTTFCFWDVLAGLNINFEFHWIPNKDTHLNLPKIIIWDYWPKFVAKFNQHISQIGTAWHFVFISWYGAHPLLVWKSYSDFNKEAVSIKNKFCWKMFWLCVQNTFGITAHSVHHPAIEDFVCTLTQHSSRLKFWGEPKIPIAQKGMASKVKLLRAGMGPLLATLESNLLGSTETHHKYDVKNPSVRHQSKAPFSVSPKDHQASSSYLFSTLNVTVPSPFVYTVEVNRPKKMNALNKVRPCSAESWHQQLLWTWWSLRPLTVSRNTGGCPNLTYWWLSCWDWSSSSWFSSMFFSNRRCGPRLARRL